MAFNSTAGRAEYTATSGQTIFPFTFKIYETSDIKVYQTLAGSTPDDATDLLIETIDYTVAITSDSGGTITLLASATVNDAITIKRDLPVVRSVEYQENGDLLASTINMDQDYQTYLIADQSDQNTRHISLQESTQGVDAYLPEPSALKVIGWNSNADGLTNYTIGADDVFINIRNEDTIAKMLALDPTVYSTVNVRGYYAPNDGGGGIFNYDATQSAVNNGGTIINGWVRQNSIEITPRMFGAKGDWDGATGTDDTTAFKNALLVSPDININDGRYLITEEIALVLGSKISFFGDVEIAIDNTFAGTYLFKPAGGISVQSGTKTTFSNYGATGVSCFGNTTGTFGSFLVEGEFTYGGFDYNYNFNGSAFFPLNVNLGNGYSFNTKYGHIYIANASPISGQSAVSIGRHVDTAPNLASTIASSLAVTVDATATTDTLIWAATGSQQTGWEVMRKPIGDTDPNSYVHLAHLSEGTLAYTASKTAATYYDYVVVVSKVSIYLENIKAVNIDVIQGEYCSSSVVFDKCRAINVNSLYNEWRGNDLTNPVPKGEAVRALSSECNIETIWAEGVGAALYSSNSKVTLRTGTISGDVENIRTNNTSSSPFVKVDNVQYTGTLFNHLQTFRATVTEESTTNDNTSTLDHTTESSYNAQFRGTTKARIRANTSDGIFEGSKFDVTVTNKSINPVYRNNSVFTVLSDGVAGTVATIARSASTAVSGMFNYTVRCVADVARRTETGVILVSGTTVSGAIVVTVGKIGSQQAINAGTLTVAFAVTDNGVNITLTATVTTSSGTDSIIMYLSPITTTNFQDITIA